MGRSRQGCLREGRVLSLADAIITRAVVPVLVLGTLFGALIGWGVAAWGVG